MKNFLLSLSLLLYFSTSAQKIDLQKVENKENLNATFSNATYEGKKSLQVSPMETESEAKLIKLNSVGFKDGSIEIDVVGKRAADAGEQARGFVGLAFRVKEDNSTRAKQCHRRNSGRN